MNHFRNTGHLGRGLALGIMSWTLAVGPVDAAPAGLNGGELRAQFNRCGFEVSAQVPNTASPYMVVRDPGPIRLRDSRVAMAIVYADVATATAEHRRVHSQAEERLGERYPFSTDHGPQLLPGYGASVWRANVAMVQSDLGTLSSMHVVDAQTGDASVNRPELYELGFGWGLLDYGVDRDFVACLEGA
jgi:hypothetical protein